MKLDNILVFDLNGDFGHFRLGYTTSSSSTHMVPPRHTVAGILGAIAGIERDRVSDLFHPDKCKIGITTENQLSLLRLSINQILVKGKATLESILTHDQHSQIPFHMIKNPHYRIYLYHKDKKFYEKLKKLLQNHECIYPPSLGMAQLLADFNWYDELLSPTIITTGTVKTKSVAPLQMFNPQPDTMTNHMVLDRQARHLDKNRQADQYYRVVFDISGVEPLTGKIIQNQGIAIPVCIDNEGKIPEVVFLW